MPKGVKMKSQALSCQRSHVSFITEKQRCIYRPYGYNLDETITARELQQRYGGGWKGAEQNTLNASPILLKTTSPLKLCCVCSIICSGSYQLPPTDSARSVTALLHFSEPDHYEMVSFCFVCSLTLLKMPDD